MEDEIWSTKDDYEIALYNMDMYADKKDNNLEYDDGMRRMDVM